MFHLALVCCGLLGAMPADSPTPEDVLAYQAAAARAGRDADAHVRLASWCETHGLQIERHKHLAIALEIDPDHATAHALLGLVADKGEWRMPEAITEDYRGDAAAKATLARYHARRDKSPNTAQAQWQLAEWCEQNGLKAEATAHLTAVVRLNPAREEAWKKLGYRKQKGRWMTAELAEAERAEADAQRKADARWRPLLQRWSGWLEKKTKRAEAEAAMSEVHDPRAVPSIWKVFIAGGPADQERAVRLLKQIDAPAASRALASLAVLGASAGVRRSAAEVLLKRDPREFAGLLISLLRDPIEYEVRLVGGPGKPGELYVHGERANSRFFYEAPPPLATLRPTDIVGFDNNGLPVANRVVGYTYAPIAAAIDPLLMGAPDLTGAPQVLARAGLGQAGIALGQRMLQNQQAATLAGISVPQGMMRMPLTTPVPVGQLMVQAEQQAAFSRARLQEDVAALDRYNQNVIQVNERAIAALMTALVENRGPKRTAWVKWWSDLVKTSTAANPRPRDLGREQEASQNSVEKRAIVPAFGAGTPVWTLSGLQPVESIRAGDVVLTQVTATGALSYTPVLAIHQGARQPIKTIALGDASIVPTDLERFWVAGKGWVMVTDLKAGDPLRALGGVVRVAVVEGAGARPVYHVQVAEGSGILVGQRGILAHDERVAYPAADPFDSAAIAEAPRSGH